MIRGMLGLSVRDVYSMLRKSYHRASVLFALHRWNDALQALDDALTRFPHAYDQLDGTPADASLRLLLTGTEAQLWPARIALSSRVIAQSANLAGAGARTEYCNVVLTHGESHRSPDMAGPLAGTWRT